MLYLYVIVLDDVIITPSHSSQVKTKFSGYFARLLLKVMKELERGKKIIL